MKKLITATFALALFAPLAVDAQEVEVTGNAGWVSEYHYRGIFQKSSSASAGLDLAVSGLYLGTWAADVGDGAEIDLYGGYGIEYEGFTASVGGTGYFYTGEFDDTYLEANFGAGYGPLSVEFSYGEWDGVDPAATYWFLGVTAEQSGFYATYGTFGEDFDGSYGEAGYGFTAADLDFGISWIYADETLGGLDGDHTLVFGVSKTFAIAP